MVYRLNFDLLLLIFWQSGHLIQGVLAQSKLEVGSVVREAITNATVVR